MGMAATTDTAGHLDVGDTWHLGVLVTDDDTGQPAAAAVTAQVILPDDTTVNPAVTEDDDPGRYSAAQLVDQAGRYVAVVSSAGDVVAVVVFAVTVDPPGQLPDLQAVKDYLRDAAAAWTDAQLADELAAETATQAKVCRTDVYTADLRQALLRRVQRALALRALPLAVLQGDAESGSLVLPGRDVLVRAREAPHRKLVVR